jgi:alpha-tubulin suppressor-like RCC1 family protein
MAQMKNSNRYMGWTLPAVLFLVLLGTAGLSWAAAPKVSAGENHSLFLHADGTLWAAGLNLSGQLGDGTLVNRNRPVRSGSDNHWQSVSAGGEHTVALKSDGTLWSWGSNASGQLGVLLPGPIPVPDQKAPLQVGAARDWVAVGAGLASSYALKADGTLWAWGQGSAGQLGNGQFARQDLPVLVVNPGSAPFVALSCGSDHVLALQSDGSLWSWGGNASGQLGQGGTVSDPSTPTQVLIPGAFTDNDWTQVAAGGGHSLALKVDGTLWSWGDNALGQLGLGSTLSQNAPVQVGTAQDWAALSAGALHSLALKRNGALWAWGDNSSGQLGLGQLTAQQNAPQQVLAAGAANLAGLGAGAFHSVALKANGDFYAWGGNLDGQLADGSTNGSSLAPELVGSAGIGWVASEPGTQFTVARRSNGTLWTWGDNSGGQLGNGSFGPDPVATPGAVDTQNNWAAQSAGSSHVAALKADGTLWTWGDNGFGQLGNNTLDPSTFPLQMTDTKPATPSDTWAAVSAGDFHTLALQGDGTVWSWGDNEFGQLGDSRNTPEGKQPHQVILGPGGIDNTWTAVAAGGTHSLALQADGTLWAWGDNGQGQLGGDPALIGAALNQPAIINVFPPPVGFPGFNHGWKAMAAGFGFSLGLQADGSLWAWGGNFNGQLGNNDPTLPNPPAQFAPVQVLNNGAPFISVAAGDAHVMARRADGSIWSWGSNQFGQLGVGTSGGTLNVSPLQEVSQSSDWAGSGIGGSHSVGLKADGTLWTWGSNQAGQLGDGTVSDRNAPTALLEAFALTPAALDFGSASVGGTGSVKNLSVGNSGNGILFVTALSLTGTNAAQYSIAKGTCSGVPAFVVPAGGSCQLAITFRPSAPLSQSALLTLSTSDPVQPQHQVALTGLGAQHVITLTPGPNGSIFGPTSVNENATPSYSIVAATNFHIVDVKVNGVSRGALSAITLAPVTADVTITASFAINSFAVSFASGGNGTLTGITSQTVNFGASATTVTAVPAIGYHFVNWTEAGVTVGTSPALTVGSLSAAHSFTANFAINSYAVSFTSGGNGTLVGNANQTVNFNFNATSVTAVPALGYHFLNWTEGAAVVGTSPALPVSNVTAAHSFTANFAIDTFTVSATGGAKGSISPAGTTSVNFGASTTFTFTPNAGYHVVKVVADGVDQGAVPPASFTFTNVTANGHTLSVSFVPDGVMVGSTIALGDALRALRIAVKLIPATPADLVHGDVSPTDAFGVPNPDGDITLGDALGILRKVVGLPSGF